jgi:hypothetical protein
MLAKPNIFVNCFAHRGKEKDNMIAAPIEPGRFCTSFIFDVDTDPPKPVYWF